MPDCRWGWELTVAIDFCRGNVLCSVGVPGRPSQDCLECIALAVHERARSRRHTGWAARKKKAEGVNVKIIHHWKVHLAEGPWGCDYQRPFWEWFSPFPNTEVVLISSATGGNISPVSFSLFSPFGPISFAAGGKKKIAHISLSAPVQPHPSLSSSPPGPCIIPGSKKESSSPAPPSHLLPNDIIYRGSPTCKCCDVTESEVAAESVSVLPHPPSVLPLRPIIQAGPSWDKLLRCCHELVDNTQICLHNHVL